MVIVIDPGHGGIDSGAGGNGLAEKDLNLKLAFLIKEILERNYGIKPVLTRTTDVYVDLKERSLMANRMQAELFISLHVNSGGKGQAGGFESYIHPEANKYIALKQQIIYKNLMEFYSHYSITDRGMKRANFAVLRETKAPAILLENLFIDNPSEAALWADSRFCNGLAIAIVNGLGQAAVLDKVKPVPSGEAGIQDPISGGPVKQPTEHWAYYYFQKLLKEGIVNSEHSLEAPVTWGELAVVIDRLRKEKGHG